MLIFFPTCGNKNKKFDQVHINNPNQEDYYGYSLNKIKKVQLILVRGKEKLPITVRYII